MSINPTKHSRRSVLTALAAVPAAGVPASAGVIADTSEPEEVFALIEAARLAKAANVEQIRFEDAIMTKVFAGELEDECTAVKAAREKTEALSEVQWEAEDAVLATKPRTRAGLAAQLMFAAECMAEEVMLADDGPYGDSLKILLLLVNVARAIDGLLVERIALSERLVKILSCEDQEALMRAPRASSGS